MRGAVALLALSACGGDGAARDLPTTWTSGERLRARLLAPVDGTPQWDGWHDRELELDCAFALTPDGTRRCLPLPAAYADRFLDDACTRPVMAFTGDCDEPRFGWVPAGCDGFTVHEAGAAVDQPASLYARSGGACVAAGTTDPSLRYREVGAAIDLDGLVAAERVERSAGDVVVLELSGDDGSRRVIGVRDAATGAPLYATFDLPNDTRDALRHWMPSWDSAAATGTYFADAECTEPVACQAASACPEPPLSLDFVFAEADECALEAVFTAIGDPVTPMAWSTGEGSCDPIPAEELATLGDCAPAGAPLAADRFPLVESTARGPGRIRALEAGVAGVAIHPEWYYFRDVGRDQPCFPLTAADGVVRCLPSFFLFYANHFLDAECTLPAGYRHEPYTDACFPDAPPPPAIVGFDDDDDSGCGSHFSDRTRHILRLVEPVDGSDTYVLDGGCVRYDPTTHPGVIFGLEEVDPGEFVQVDVVVE